MQTTLLPELVKQLFIDGPSTPNDLPMIEIKYGLQLKRIGLTRFDLRHNYAKDGKRWLLNEAFGWNGGLLSEEDYPHQWDMLTDGSVLCYKQNFAELVFYSVAQMESIEHEKLQEEAAKKLVEAQLRTDILQRLTPLLIEQMYPYSKLFSGELETIYGVHLKEFNRGMHMNMRFKPGYGDRGWVRNKPLSWGANTGWDITLDGKIACCRVDYDDYINFEIVPLTPAEMADYKTQFSQPDVKLINRLATLQQMMNKQLITAAEFQQKKKEILDTL